MTELTTGGYVRHRDRMVQESVFEDLRDTLIACRWLAGTTAGAVRDPMASDAVADPLTVAQADTLPLLEGNPLVLIDYFPEAEGAAVTGDADSTKTALNTLALDNGTAIERVPLELGSSSESVTYRFNLAFYAASDAVAQAVLNDLTDRYRGRLVRNDVVALWNYNSAATDPVVWMSVENFQYTQNTDSSVATPYGVHLYFGELIVEDQVD